MEAVSGVGPAEHGFLVSLSTYLTLFILMTDTGFSSNCACFHLLPNLTFINVKKKDSY